MDDAPEFPRAPKGHDEYESIQLRSKENIHAWCGKQKMDDPRIILCTRFKGHDGDHVASCEDYSDGRVGVVIARWPQSPTPSAPFDYAAAWMSVRGALHDGRDEKSEEFPDWDDLNTSERAAFARWVDELRGK